MGDPPSFAGGSQVIIHQSSPTSVTFGASGGSGTSVVNKVNIIFFKTPNFLLFT